MIRPDLYTSHVDHRVLGLEITADELERLQDRDGSLDTGESFPRELLDDLAFADGAYNGAGLTLRDVCFGADVFEPLDDVIDLSRFRIVAHHDDQRLVPTRFGSARQRSLLRSGSC